MKKIYFIDYENISGDTILPKIIEALPPDSWYYVFYSEHTKPPEYILKNLPDRPIWIRFIDCVTGSHDAMDFRIVACLSRMSALHPNAQYIIISNDTGYDPALTYLQDQGVRAFRVTPPCIETKDGDSEAQRKKTKSDYITCVHKAMASLGRDESEAKVLCSSLAYTKDLKMINNTLQKMYKGKKNKYVPIIYKAIKAQLTEKGLV